MIALISTENICQSNSPLFLRYLTRLSEARLQALLLTAMNSLHGLELLIGPTEGIGLSLFILWILMLSSQLKTS